MNDFQMSPALNCEKTKAKDERYRAKKDLVDTARGLKKADVVFKNARIVNVYTHQIVEGDLALCGDRIAGIGDYQGKKEIDLNGKLIVPGLIDAHFHIESTMTIPSQLSPVLLAHGITTLIADPHEIVNASGSQGLDFMLEDAAKADLDIRFMIPSSVPSCDFEVNGAGVFRAEQMKPYLNHPDVLGLAEVMRMGDVLTTRQDMFEKMDLFEGRKIDGHAPGLKGKDLQAYRAAGIVNDHEASSFSQALDRLQNGFQLLIRQGSGAGNLYDILPGLLENKIPLDHCSFCTDDKHIEDILEEGTIDHEIREAIQLGCHPIETLCVATLNTAEHYGLNDRGALIPGAIADLVILNDLQTFEIDAVWKSGRPVEESLQQNLEQPVSVPKALTDSVHLPGITADDLDLKAVPHEAIELVSGQLLTKRIPIDLDQTAWPNGEVNLLLAAERYGKTGEFAICPLLGFGIHNGAIAMSYAHDSHNVIAVADCTDDLLLALKTLEEIGGGVVLVENGRVFESVPMEASGLMSVQPAKEVARKLHRMKCKARKMGVVQGIDPFANLSFLSLPVIPQIRLVPQGLYDLKNHSWISKGKKKQAK